MSSAVTLTTDEDTDLGIDRSILSVTSELSAFAKEGEDFEHNGKMLLCERLTDERLKELRSVFADGNADMKVRADPVRATELRNLLNQQIEPDTACWINGKASRYWSHPSMPGGNCYCCAADLKSAYIGGKRHHCRRCGSLVCSDCSKSKLYLWVFWGQNEETGTWSRYVINHEAAFSKSQYKSSIEDENPRQNSMWSSFKAKFAARSRPRKESARTFMDSLEVDSDDLYAEYKDLIGFRKTKPKRVCDMCLHSLFESRQEQNKGKSFESEFSFEPKQCSICKAFLPLNESRHHKQKPSTEGDAMWTTQEGHHFKVCLHCKLLQKETSNLGSVLSYKVSIKGIHPCATELDLQVAIDRACGDNTVLSIEFERDPDDSPSLERFDIIGASNHYRHKMPSYATTAVVSLVNNTAKRTLEQLCAKSRGLEIEVACGPKKDDYLTSYAVVMPLIGPVFEERGVLSQARKKVQEFKVKQEQQRWLRRQRRTYGDEMRCMGLPDCHPGRTNKTYCGRCGGARGNRRGLAGKSGDAHNAIFAAIQLDDVVCLRANIRLKIQEKREEVSLLIKKDSTSVASSEKGTSIASMVLEKNHDKNIKDDPYITLSHRLLDLRSQRGPGGASILHMAVLSDAVQCAKVIVGMNQNYPEMQIFQWRDNNGMTVLHTAISSGSSLVKYVLESGAWKSIPVVDNFGRVALHYASLKGDLSTVKDLLMYAQKLEEHTHGESHKNFQLLLRDRQGRLAVDYATNNAVKQLLNSCSA